MNGCAIFKPGLQHTPRQEPTFGTLHRLKTNVSKMAEAAALSEEVDLYGIGFVSNGGHFRSFEFSDFTMSYIYTNLLVNNCCMVVDVAHSRRLANVRRNNLGYSLAAVRISRIYQRGSSDDCPHET